MAASKTPAKREQYPFFAGSSAQYHQIPPPSGDEIALLGRSNVGKSSFINHALGNGRLARVSATPGKTRLANLYRVNPVMTWVDLPGYGYARASHDEKDRWSSLIADYCSRRENLRGIVWLLDIRHPGVAMDREAAAWLLQLNKPVFVVFTKADKLTPQAVSRQCRDHYAALNIGYPWIAYSIRDENARFRFLKAFEPWCLSMGVSCT